VEPGASGAAANVGTFTASGSPWLSPDAPNATPDTQADGNLEANRVVVSNDPNILILPNQFFMFRWVDTNLGGSDGHQGIDDFSISFTSISNLVYNLTHSVGGSPHGVLEISASTFWTDVATPSGFTNGSQITFSQAGTATISVPADVSPLLTVVSAASGSYTIGGAGRINGPLTKSGAGTLVLTSANDFTTATLSGGIVELRAPGALGTGQVTVSAASTLNIRDNGSGDNGQIEYGNNITISSGTTISLDRAAGGTSVGNTVAFGSLSIGTQTLTINGANGYKARFDGNVTLTGNASINTNTEVTLAAAISGTFSMTKTGTGRLVLDAVNTFTGALTVNGGTVGGTGILTGPLSVNAATLAPGNGPGIFATNSNLTLSGTSTFSLELSHGVAALPEPGTDYDQMLVGSGVGTTTTGTVIVSNATLALTIGSGIQVNDIFYIIINDGVDVIAGTGTFNGLPQDATIAAGGHTFRISYRANSVTGLDTGGNDVALIVVPEPGSALLALFGACGLFAGRRRRR
jgi:fibronectin-binding autotransporter adhesin